MPPPSAAGYTEVTIYGGVQALTAPPVFVSLTPRNFSASSYLSDGTDIQAYDQDGTTPLTTSLRRWGASGGIYLKARYAPPSGYIYGTAAAFGQNGRLLAGYGEDIGGANETTANGIFRLLNRDGSVAWSFETPTESDYIMGAASGDVDGDGTHEIVVTSRKRSRRTYLLDANGNQLWNYDHGLASEGTGAYARGCSIGKVRSDVAGNQVLTGGVAGVLALLDKDGNVLWEKKGATALSAPDTSTNSDRAVQQCEIIEDDGAGSAGCYCVHTRGVHRFNGSGTNVWSTTLSALDLIPYGMGYGNVTSATTKQVVVAMSRTGQGVGRVACVNATDGAVQWQVPVPFSAFDACCIDINGDGFDEVIVGGGGHVVGDPPNIAAGGLLVLDRNGNEIGFASLGSSVKYLSADRSAGEIFCSCDDGYHYLFGVASGSSASVRVTLPNLSANATRTIYLAPTGASAIRTADAGDYDASTPGTGPLGSNWTARQGTWTFNAGKLRSPDEGNTSTVPAAEIAGSSERHVEIRFRARKVSVADNTAFDYYHALYYGASGWSGGLPTAYRVQIGTKGNLFLHRVTAGSSAVTYTLYDDGTGGANLWPGCSTTDDAEFIVTWANAGHALAFRINGGAWTTAYNVQDTNAGRITTAGAVALASNRGRSDYDNIRVHSIPASLATDSTGPGPVPLAAFSARGRGARRSAALNYLIQRAARGGR